MPKRRTRTSSVRSKAVPGTSRSRRNGAPASPDLHAVNEDIASGFDEMADLLALSGENPFRIRAYRRAAQVVRALPEELADSIARGFDPDSLPGIGPDLATKIREFAATGHCRALDELRGSVPASLRELLSLPGIGPQRARALFQALKVHDLPALQKAVEAHRVRQVPGFGARTEETLRLHFATQAGQEKRVRRTAASAHARNLQAHLAALPGVSRVEVAGSFRRFRDTVGDLDLVVCCDARIDLRKALLEYPETARLLAAGSTRLSILLRSGLQADIRVVPRRSFGAALYYFTGSKAHNIHVRRIAMSRGLKINEYGVFKGTARIAGDTEESVFAAVELPYIPPELREDRGEIEAAGAGTLPRLVEAGDLRGDLHVHTVATDGTAPLRDMVEAARRANLAYMAVTDHGKHIGAVHGLDATALDRQIDEIDALNAANRGFTIFKGVEVDVLEDGSLALPDAVLRRLDLVVAAVPGHFNLDRRQQTDRLLRVLDQRCVSILAHPTGRLLGERPGIDCDWSPVFRRASARPCYLELNAQPLRLDLDDILVREAAANGILISIASDAHGINDFGHLPLGIMQARRGWITAAQVLNTRPARELQGLLKRTFL